MKAREVYEFWLNDPYFDQETKKELLAIKDDEGEIEERFYRDLGVRNRRPSGDYRRGNEPHEYLTVRKATQGLANYIIKEGAREKGRCHCL